MSERRVLFPRNRRIILKSLSGWSENIIETGNLAIDLALPKN